MWKKISRNRWLMAELTFMVVTLAVAMTFVLPRFRAAQAGRGPVKVREAELQAVADALLAYELERGPWSIPEFAHIPNLSVVTDSMVSGEALEPFLRKTLDNQTPLRQSYIYYKVQGYQPNIESVQFEIWEGVIVPDITTPTLHISYDPSNGIQSPGYIHVTARSHIVQ